MIMRDGVLAHTEFSDSRKKIYFILMDVCRSSLAARPASQKCSDDYTVTEFRL